MIFMNMILITMIFLMITMNYPLMIISSILLITISGSYQISLSNNMNWISMIIFMLFVGGLMITYLFIMSMNSNEKSKEKTKLMFTSSIILAFILSELNQKKTMSKTISILYSMSWSIISMIMFCILITMYLMTKMIKTPTKTMKSMK